MCGKLNVSAKTHGKSRLRMRVSAFGQVVGAFVVKTGKSPVRCSAGHKPSVASGELSYPRRTKVSWVRFQGCEVSR